MGLATNSGFGCSAWRWLACLAAAHSSAAQPPVRVGGEFQVNSSTTHVHYRAALSLDDDGDFVVVSRRRGQDGLGSGVFARRFDSAGVAQASDFPVGSHTTGIHLSASVSLDSDGDFVVAWQNFTPDTGSSRGVFARRFDAAGAPLTAEFQVDSHTAAFATYADVSLDDDGDFVVVWGSYGQDGSGYGVFGRRFDSAGVAQGTEFQVNSHTANDQSYPAVSLDGDGDFVVTWSSEGQDGSSSGVFARRFDSAGVARGPEFQVNSHTPDYQRFPDVSLDGDGDFVVAWHSYGQDGSPSSVFARRFDSAGGAQAAEFRVNSYTAGFQKVPVVSLDDDGDFVVAWESTGQDGSYSGIFARLYDSAGMARSPEFQVNSSTIGFQQLPAVSIAGDGGFVVAWESSSAVFAQRFAVATDAGLAVLDVDGDGETNALTDALLVLRYLFGLIGAPLVAEAIDPVACTRCDAAAVGTYLDGLGDALDIDGDGNVRALTDGLLILRHSFGLTGAPLVEGAVDAGCTRCDPESIDAHLQTLI